MFPLAQFIENDGTADVLPSVSTAEAGAVRCAAAKFIMPFICASPSHLQRKTTMTVNKRAFAVTLLRLDANYTQCDKVTENQIVCGNSFTNACKKTKRASIHALICTYKYGKVKTE